MPPVVIEALSLDFVEPEHPAMITKQNNRLISDVTCLTIDCISPSEVRVISREVITICTAVYADIRFVMCLLRVMGWSDKTETDVPSLI